MTRESPRSSRYTEWRHLRLRRLVAALLAGVAVVVGLTALRPASAPTTGVVVATRDLPAGHRLGAHDLAIKTWASDAAPPERPGRAALTGRRVLGPVKAGEPLTSSRLLTAAAVRPPTAGDRVISVPLTDPGLTQVLRPGARVDVLDAEGTAAARSADLLAVVPPGGDDTSWKAGSTGSALVAVSPLEARAIARSSASPAGRSALTLVLVGRTSG